MRARMVSGQFFTSVAVYNYIDLFACANDAFFNFTDNVSDSIRKLLGIFNNNGTFSSGNDACITNSSAAFSVERSIEKDCCDFCTICGRSKFFAIFAYEKEFRCPVFING